MTLERQIVGVTNVVLTISRTGECNLGNFVTDAMIDWVMSNCKFDYLQKSNINLANSKIS